MVKRILWIALFCVSLFSSTLTEDPPEQFLERLYDAQVVLHGKVINKTTKRIMQVNITKSGQEYPLYRTRYYTDVQVLCILKTKSSDAIIPQKITLDTEIELKQVESGQRYIFSSGSFSLLQITSKNPTYITEKRFIYDATENSLISAARVCGLQNHYTPNNSMQTIKDIPIVCPRITVKNTTCIDRRTLASSVTMTTSSNFVLTMNILFILLWKS